MAGADFLAQIRLAITGAEEVVTKLNNVSRAKAQMSETPATVAGLERVAQDTSTASKSVKDFSDTLVGFKRVGTQTTETYDGVAYSGKRVVETFRNQQGAIGTVISTYNAAGERLKTVSTQTKQASVATNEFVLAMKRALIVAPIWMVARESLKAVIDFVKDGIKYWLETEEATHNLTMSLGEMGVAGKESVDAVVQSMHKLSIETGRSEAALINMYATVQRILGNKAESEKAVTEATKLSLETGVDGAKAAETMAMLYQLAGNSMDAASKKTKNFADISTLLYTTAARTPGGASKLIADLQGFNATMSIADFGLENSIRLMGAFERTGITSGQGLKTGLMKVLTNMDEISSQLRISLPENASSAEKFKMIIDKLSTAKKDTAYFEVLKQIFGTGGKGTINVAALTKDIKLFDEALSGKGVTMKERYMQQQQLEDITKGAGHQLEVFGNLKKQIGEYFIAGITGSQDFADGLNNINKALEKQNSWTSMSTWAQGLGHVVNTTWQMMPWVSYPAIWKRQSGGEDREKQIEKNKTVEDLQKRITLGLTGELTVEENIALQAEVKTTKLIEQKLIRDQLVERLREENNLVLSKTHAEEASLAIKQQEQLLVKEQVKSLESLLVQYSRANGFEKHRLKRTMELVTMSPESLSALYSSGGLDKRLITENIGLFATAQKAKIYPNMAAEAGMSSYFPGEMPATPNPNWRQEAWGKKGTTEAIPRITQENKFGDININIPAETQKGMKQEIIDQFLAYLEANPKAAKALSTVIFHQDIDSRKK